MASQIAGLCTLDGSLPQGAPTSPALANAVFHEVDLKLEQLAEAWCCTYTRYADDLTFSGERRFSRLDVEAVGELVVNAGFTLNPDKSRILGPGSRQVVAGIVTNKVGLPPRQIRRRWRAMFHRAERFPGEFRDKVQHLLGVASFVNQYSPNLATHYFDLAGRVLAEDRHDSASSEEEGQ